MGGTVLIKLLRHSFALVSTALLVSWSQPLAAVGSSELKPLLVNAVDWPPFFIRKSSAGLPGFAREILDYCLPKTGYVARYEWLPVKRTYQYMQQGKLDLAVYSKKTERESYIRYGSLPMFTSEVGFAVRSDFKPDGRELADVKPFRFGYLAGLALTPELNELLEQKRAAGRAAVEVFQLTDLFAKLLQQPAPVDVVVNSKETLNWLIFDLGIQHQAKVLPYAVGRKSYYLTLSRKSANVTDPEKFFQQFDACLSDFQKQAAFNSLLRRYQLGL